MSRSILAALSSGDIGGLAGLLAADAVFSSPVADYRGRERAAHLLGLIADVVEDVTPERAWIDGPESVTAFTATVSGKRLEGMLRESRDATGAIAQATLFLRPYGALKTAIGRMGVLLERHPAPGEAT